MAGVNWSHWYGFPGRQNVNGGCRHGQELTGSPMKMISAFGVGSRGEVNGGVALEREILAGEVQSGAFVTKSTRYGYLRTRVVTAELQAASASSFEARARGTTAAVVHGCEQGMGREGGALLGVI